LNRSSGWDDSEQGVARLEEILTGARTELVKKGANCGDIALEAVRGGARAVAAGGGDGTIRAVAEALAGTGVPLGVIPVGTLNHFARDLNIPLDVQAAAEVIREGAMTDVDLGEVNNRVFINNAIIGLYPAYRAERGEEERRGAEGAFAVAGAALSVFRRNPALLARMRLDGRELVRHSPLIVVANNEHKMEGYQLGSRNRMDTGRLWIYVMRPRGRAGLLRTFASIAAGRLAKRREFEIFTAREAVIDTGRKHVRVSLDGEILELDGPLRFRSRSRALKVIVPRAA
jgi:diacylglycerol kinase family enzyme